MNLVALFFTLFCCFFMIFAATGIGLSLIYSSSAHPLQTFQFPSLVPHLQRHFSQQTAHPNALDLRKRLQSENRGLPGRFRSPMLAARLRPVHGRNVSIEWLVNNRGAVITEEYELAMAGKWANVTLPRIANETDLAPVKLPLIFLHLPKTGGTTLGDLAQNKSGFCVYRFWDDFLVSAYIKLTAPGLSLDRCILFGHLSYGYHFFFPPQSSYATILRDPIARTLSHYFYHLKNKKDRNHAFTRGKSLQDWMASSINANNRMTQFLAGFPNTPPTRLHLDLAKFHLRRFAIVGLTERWNDTLRLLRERGGWANLEPDNDARMNQGSWNTVTPADIASVRAVNQLDLELYEYGKEIFEMQLRSLTVNR